MYIYADISCILIGVDSGENLRITEKGAGAEIMNRLSEVAEHGQKVQIQFYRLSKSPFLKKQIKQILKIYSTCTVD
jgi:hypothetical protein